MAFKTSHQENQSKNMKNEFLLVQHHAQKCDLNNCIKDRSYNPSCIFGKNF